MKEVSSRNKESLQAPHSLGASLSLASLRSLTKVPRVSNLHDVNSWPSNFQQLLHRAEMVWVKRNSSIVCQSEEKKGRKKQRLLSKRKSRSGSTDCSEWASSSCCRLLAASPLKMWGCPMARLLLSVEKDFKEEMWIKVSRDLLTQKESTHSMERRQPQEKECYPKPCFKLSSCPIRRLMGVGVFAMMILL